MNCIIWTRAKTSAGYGLFREDGNLVYAHRRAWEEANGRKLNPGEVVHHLCENPPCVNPDHLTVTDQPSHAYDHMRVISERDVKQIRQLRAQGLSYREIERETGWSRETARRYIKSEQGHARDLTTSTGSR
jgi:hypothetical protein